MVQFDKQAIKDAADVLKPYSGSNDPEYLAELVITQYKFSLRKQLGYDPDHPLYNHAS